MDMKGQVAAVLYALRRMTDVPKKRIGVLITTDEVKLVFLGLHSELTLGLVRKWEAKKVLRGPSSIRVAHSLEQK